MALTGKKFRIIIADDHEIYRFGISTILREDSDIRIEGEACDGEELVDLAGRVRCDMAIADFSMPRLTGLDALTQIKERRPETLTVLLTVSNDTRVRMGAHNAGINGFLLKEKVTDQIVDAVRRIRRGETVFHETASGQTAIAADHSRLQGLLTEKEICALRLIASGLPYKSVAAQMGVTVKTVDYYKSTLSRKLNVSSVAELARVAMAHQLL